MFYAVVRLHTFEYSCTMATLCVDAMKNKILRPAQCAMLLLSNSTKNPFMQQAAEYRTPPWWIPTHRHANKPSDQPLPEFRPYVRASKLGEPSVP